MSRPLPRPRGDEGFALAEVLVAFAILALVSLAMIRASAGSSAALARAADREARLAQAEALMERWRARPTLAEGIERGESGRLSWQVEAQEVPSAGLPPPEGGARPVRLTIRVGERGAPADAELTLTTLVLAVRP